MKEPMKAQPRGLMFQADEPARVELVLSRSDGTSWTLSMSAGSERFVGRYPRIPRLLIDGPLLPFRAPYPGT
jgi:hypothetical protein